MFPFQKSSPRATECTLGKLCTPQYTKEQRWGERKTRVVHKQYRKMAQKGHSFKCDEHTTWIYQKGKVVGGKYRNMAQKHTPQMLVPHEHPCHE